MCANNQRSKVLMAYSVYGLILFWILISIFICVDDICSLQSVVVLTLGVFNAFIWTCGLSNWMTLSVSFYQKNLTFSVIFLLFTRNTEMKVFKASPSWSRKIFISFQPYRKFWKWYINSKNQGQLMGGWLDWPVLVPLYTEQMAKKSKIQMKFVQFCLVCLE